MGITSVRKIHMYIMRKFCAEGIWEEKVMLQQTAAGEDGSLDGGIAGAEVWRKCFETILDLHLGWRWIGGLCQCRVSELLSLACWGRQMKSFEAGGIGLESRECQMCWLFVVFIQMLDKIWVWFYPSVERVNEKTSKAFFYSILDVFRL